MIKEKIWQSFSRPSQEMYSQLISAQKFGGKLTRASIILLAPRCRFILTVTLITPSKAIPTSGSVLMITLMFIMMLMTIMSEQWHGHKMIIFIKLSAPQWRQCLLSSTPEITTIWHYPTLRLSTVTLSPLQFTQQQLCPNSSIILPPHFPSHQQISNEELANRWPGIKLSIYIAPIVIENDDKTIAQMECNLVKLEIKQLECEMVSHKVGLRYLNFLWQN